MLAASQQAEGAMSADIDSNATIDTPQERRNVALLQRVYDAYRRGDPSVFFAAADENLRFGIAGPTEHFRFAGIKHGLAWAKKVLAEIAEDFEWLDYQVRDFIAEREWVIALTGGKIRDRASGVILDADLVDVIRLKDGRITDFLEYYDTTFLAERNKALAQFRTTQSPKRKTKQKAKAKAKAKAAPKRKSAAAPKRRASKRKRVTGR
jgi:ketosteroid isomerase-like protein